MCTLRRWTLLTSKYWYFSEGFQQIRNNGENFFWENTRKNNKCQRVFSHKLISYPQTHYQSIAMLFNIYKLLIADYNSNFNFISFHFTKDFTQKIFFHAVLPTAYTFATSLSNYYAYLNLLFPPMLQHIKKFISLLHWTFSNSIIEIVKLSI